MKILSITSRLQVDQIAAHSVVEKVEMRCLERSPNSDSDLAVKEWQETWRHGERRAHEMTLMERDDSETGRQKMQMQRNNLALTAGQRLDRGVVIFPVLAKDDDRNRGGAVSVGDLGKAFASSTPMDCRPYLVLEQHEMVDHPIC